MIDETGIPQSAVEEPLGAGSSQAATGAEPTVAFCQQCGRPLTALTRRQVGSGTFCEPCATLRWSCGSGWTAVNTAPPQAAYPSPKNDGQPNPGLAGFLGLIPGVGAMYNGQYAKAVIHLVVFVVLVSLADNLNWVFWWFVWGWIFYQAFEAYHTAEARRTGQPVPDPFGWNDLGERLGYDRRASGNARYPGTPPSSAPPAAAPSASVFTSSPPVPPVSPVSFTPLEPFAPAPPVAPFAAVPPTPAYAAAASPIDPAAASYTAPGTPGYAQPYAFTYTGPYPGSGDLGFPQVSTTAPLPRAGSFPAGAAWLIGLGVLFLLGNLLPSWHLDGRWLVPLLLAALAVWLAAQRWSTYRAVAGTAPLATSAASFAETLTFPALLLTVAVLLALQDARWFPLRHSWPALLIVWGAMLLVQRVPLPQQNVSPNPTEATASSVADAASR